MTRWLVYRITNSVNGKIYIGITSRDVPNRLREHQRAAKQGNDRLLLYRAMRAHGPENFTIAEICCALSRADMLTLETDFIRAERANDPAHGYNCTEGGVHPQHNATTRQRISEKRKGFRYTAEQRAALSAARKGRPHSPERRLAEAARLKMLMARPDHGARISAAMTGRKKGPQPVERRLAKKAAMRAFFAAKDPASHGSVLRQVRRIRGKEYVSWIARVRYHKKTHTRYCRSEAEAESARREMSLMLYGEHATLPHSENARPSQATDRHANEVAPTPAYPQADP